MKVSLLIAAFAALGFASPQPSPDVSQLVKTTGGRNVTSFSLDQQHENIIKAFDSKHVIHSDNLHDYFLNNHGANHTIYINDTRRFIDMSQVTKELDKRQYGNPCFGYTNYWALQPQSWWGHWSPASACLYTGNDPAGGSYNLGWSFSTSITENIGLSWGVIKDVLGFSSGISVTETWSHSGSITCNIPGNSVGQIWIQTYVVWGWIWSEGCKSCNYGSGCGRNYGMPDPAPMGGASAPGANTDGNHGAQYGCSSGYDKVSC